MKNIIIILISILSLSVKGQNIPTEYKGQKPFSHSTIESCPGTYLTNNPYPGFNNNIKPYQPIEMVNIKEKEIYNKIKDSKPNLFIQGVVIIPSVGTTVVYTYKNSDGKYQVLVMDYQNW